MKSKNISYKLSVYLLISGTILSVFVIFLGYNYVRHTIFESYRYRLQYDVQEVLGEVQNTMIEAARFTDHLASGYFWGIPPKNQQIYLEGAFNSQPNMRAFGMISSSVNRPNQIKTILNFYRSKSSIKSDTGKFDSNNSKTNGWIEQKLKTTKSGWSSPYYDHKTGSRVVIYSKTIEFNRNGNVEHVSFFCAVSLDQCLNKMGHQKLIKSGFAILLDENNKVVYHPDSTRTGKDISSLFNCLGGKEFDLNKVLSSRIPGFQIIHPNCMKNRRTVAIYWPVKSSNWFIITIISEGLFMSELKHITLILVLLVLLIGSITAGILIYLSTRLVSPIAILADDSRKIIEEAGFDPVEHLNDLEALSDSMKKMKERLTNYRKNTLQNTLDHEEMEKELNLAKEIEMGMVPSKFPLYPARHDFDCFGRLIPARIVGGDLFDIFLLDDNQLFISITDTLGKGIPAAMFSVMTRTFIRSIANPVIPPGKIMEALNDGVSLGQESDMFATVLLGKLNLTTGEFIYSNAGHPHPILLRNNGSVEFLTKSHGIPVGVKRNQHFSETRVVLEPDESLVVFTDGVTEEYNDQGEFFGIERLISVISPIREMPTQHIVSNVIDVLNTFRGRAEVHDDTTILAIKFLGK